jgi:hypothetical protein
MDAPPPWHCEHGIASTLYLGVSFGREDRAALLAYAWLRAGDKILTGAAEAARHQELASFADLPPNV